MGDHPNPGQARIRVGTRVAALPRKEPALAKRAAFCALQAQKESNQVVLDSLDPREPDPATSGRKPHLGPPESVEAGSGDVGAGSGDVGRRIRLLPSPDPAFRTSSLDIPSH